MPNQLYVLIKVTQTQLNSVFIYLETKWMQLYSYCFLLIYKETQVLVG